MGAAKKKLPCLNRLSELTTTMVCIVKNLTTITLTYTIGVTNLEFTLGLTEHLDEHGNKIDDLFLPRTLRVKDNAIDISKDGEIVDFIFMKDASVSTYSTLLFADDSKEIPKVLEGIINPSFFRNKIELPKLGKKLKRLAMRRGRPKAASLLFLLLIRITMKAIDTMNRC